MKINMLTGEAWYGGCTSWGICTPLDEKSVGTFSLTPNPTPNQAMPVLLSSQGRVLWMKGCDGFSVSEGMIQCSGCARVEVFGNTLRSAYLGASEKYFPFTGKAPDEALFYAPIFNSWIELTFHQSQEAILRYAQSILEAGFEPGVLMIDDGWAECYGAWQFHSGRFPQPKEMLRQLHHMGFKVMVWVCPYVAADSMAYRDAWKRGVLLKNGAGDAYALRWWNGISAGLDLSNPSASDWLHKQLEALMELGIDGFKFDGGDPLHYASDCHSFGNVDANELCRLWGQFGEQYPLNEYRVTWMAGGRPLFQRLCDKEHSWGTTGLGALIPDTLAQGITGHPFCCADMVGGGEYLNFLDCSDFLDGELFVKHGAVSCLMPSIQFSAAPWRILNEDENQAIHSQLELRKSFHPELHDLLHQAATSGEPIVRYMEYVFPNQGFQAVTDQFMLGENILAAPVLEKGTSGRTVQVPRGKWQYGEAEITSTGEPMYFSSPETFIVVLRKI